MIARAFLGALVMLSTAGCAELLGDGSADAHQPGTEIGTFHVAATLTSNTCGEGAFGEAAAWAFDVKLARSEGALYWNNGQEVLAGTLGDDGVSFAFESGVIQDMRPEEQIGMPPCSIARRDRAAGALDAAGDDVASFEGTLSYDFSPTAGSQCDDLIGLNSNEPVALTLPCGFAYRAEGTRTDP
jgi:hypothetical protein